MKYIIEDNIVYVQPNSNIDDIFTVNATYTSFCFEKGDFFITNKLMIPKSNVKMYSRSGNPVDVHIFQNSNIHDGLVLNYVNNVMIQDISIHVTAPGKIALTEASCNYVTIKNCYIYGTSNTFTVFFAGPKNITEGQQTLDAYYNNKLDNRNKFINNVIYSNWSGDSVSFSLQKNGSFNNNIIRGGKVAIYMCNNVNVNRNTIYDSTSQGIYISMPTKNINISRNKIYECMNSNIKIDNQTEHGIFPISESNINITNNYFYDAHYSAIELGNCKKVSILNNKFVQTDRYSIYCLNSNDININNNTISYSIVTLWLENSNYVNFDSNLIYSVYPDHTNNVVKMVLNSTNNNIINNTIKGIVKFNLFAVDSSCINNNITNNITQKYYTRSEELDIMK